MMNKDQCHEDVVGQFYRGAGKLYETKLDDLDALLLRTELIMEEAKELYQEAANIRLHGAKFEYVHNLLKELGDVLYTAYGVVGTLGVDASVVFNRVAQSNLSKIEGGAIRNEKGKIMKGPKYQPPDFTDMAEELLFEGKETMT